MNKERAIQIIEELRNYAYENWDVSLYGDDLDEIGEAVDFITEQFKKSKNVGSAEINGKRYLISEV